MILTPRAEALRQPLLQILSDVRAMLETETFDPQHSRRRFRLMLPDPVAHLMMPALLQCLQTRAPGMVIEGMSWRGPELLNEWTLRDVDMIITSVDREWPGFDREPLYQDRDLAVVRREHPDRHVLGTIDGLSHARHVSVVGAGERSDILEEWLTTTPILRNVAAVAPSYVAALRIVSSTDLVAIVPGRLARSFARPLKLQLIPLPLDPGIDAMDLLCQKRLDKDAAAIWLKGILSELAQSI